MIEKWFGARARKGGDRLLELVCEEVRRLFGSMRNKVREMES